MRRDKLSEGQSCAAAPAPTCPVGRSVVGLQLAVLLPQLLDLLHQRLVDGVPLDQAVDLVLEGRGEQQMTTIRVSQCCRENNGGIRRSLPTS